MNKQDCDTPALLVDLDKMEKNMRRMSDFAKECGVQLRPHVKTHKIPEIAKMQLAAGSTGVCLQKESEAEIFADHGIRDIFITNEIVGWQKLQRLARLAQKTHLGVAADNAENISDLGRACSEAGSEIDVYVDVDAGMHRCGVTPPQTVELAEKITKQKNLVFKGLMGYEGHVGNAKTKGERLRLANDAMKTVSEAKNLIKQKGINVEVVSVGSSVSTWINAKHPDVTEVQPGMYLFNAGNLVDSEVATVDDCALTVLATVMSKPTEDRAIVDAGSKAFQIDQGKFPWAKGLEGVKMVTFSEEHGWLSLSDKSKQIKVGDKIEFIPYHCCTAINQYDEMIGYRGSNVELTWKVAARGKMK